MLKALVIAATIFVSSVAFSDTYVRGYTRKNGTYVQPHYRSSPDRSKLNNWSTQGNVNPYTGRAGTVNPYDNDDSSGDD